MESEYMRIAGSAARSAAAKGSAATVSWAGGRGAALALEGGKRLPRSNGVVRGSQERLAADVILLAFVSDRRRRADFCQTRVYILRKSSLPSSTPLWRKMAYVVTTWK